MKHNKYQLKIEHLWGIAALLGIFMFVNTHPIRPHDFWWHLAIGREISATGKIPTVDVYSYTEFGQPYPSYQMFWLMDTLLYKIYQLGGPALIVFVHSLWITVAYGVIFWICKEKAKSWRIATLSVLVAAALGLNDWNVRPQGITFLLGSLFLFAIYQYNRKQQWPWLVIFPLGMLIWVNSHGTFLIGLVLVGIWWGQRLWEAFIQQVRRHNGRIAYLQILIPSILFFITLVICLVNPRGIGIIDYIKTLTTNSVVQNLATEWAPPSLHTYLGIIFFSSMLFLVILLAISPKRPSFSQIASLIIFGLLGIRTSRGIVWFGLITAPILADHLSSIINHYLKARMDSLVQEGNRIINYVFLVVILLMGVFTLPWFKSILPLTSVKAGLISAETPVQATQVLLAQDPSGRLFNSMSFGSYLIWAAYPQYQVFVDTRIELFSEKIWEDYLNISNAKGDWEARLSEYGVKIMMLSPMEQPALIKAVEKSNLWQLIYQDNAASLYIYK